MNCEIESVVIDDDDDDVEIVEINHNDGDQSCPTPKKPSSSIKQNQSVPSLNGYFKPSYSYAQLITHALVACPGKRATAMRICELIASKQPYYKYNKGYWHGSIYSALTRRKKFFVIVGTNENNEYIWSFNPTFEKHMLDKWVPKYAKQSFNKNVPATVTAYSENTCLPNPLFSSSESLNSRSGVITSSESLRSDYGSTSLGITSPEESGPEFALADPDQMVDFDVDNEQNHNPWEPEVTVSESAPDPISNIHCPTESAPGPISNIRYPTESPPGPTPDMIRYPTENVPGPTPNIIRYPTESGITPDITRYSADFSLDNLLFKINVDKEEYHYRQVFHTEHPAVLKFRLHCTVCDVHLGTSGIIAKKNIRFHANLGVLTCNACYHKSKSNTHLAVSVCHWCSLQDGVHFYCSSCPLKFCEACVQRNFGVVWCSRISQKTDWQCFQCDKKQIWPHRAIAYFLYLHYLELKKMKNQIVKGASSGSNVLFFLTDLSTCCKGVPSSSTYNKMSNFVSLIPPPTVVFTQPQQSLPLPQSPTESHNNLSSHSIVFSNDSNSVPLTTSSQQQMFVVDKQSPNQIYVQTSAGVPSLTLNTGTQYIHNVYPDNNYVFVHPNKTVCSTNNTPMPSVISHTHIPENNPVLTGLSKPTDAAMKIPLSQPLMSSKESPQFSLADPSKVHGTKTNDVSTLSNGICTTLNNTLPNNNSTVSKLIHNDQVIPCGGFITKLTNDDTIIVPDNDSLEKTPFTVPETRVMAPKMLTLKERIEKRPMPKSKKQSLLRAVLMSESIESMKRHLQSSNSQSSNYNSQHITAPLPEEIELDNRTNTNSHLKLGRTCNDGGKNVEEPILKSCRQTDIQTAANRFLNYQKTQNSANSITGDITDNESNMTISLECEEIVDLSIDNNDHPTLKRGLECIGTERRVPKIKIRTLQELQEPKSEQNELDRIQKSNKEYEAILIEDSQVNTLPTEINVTGLKRGIIEASRALVNTQKKFKELAKIISSNLSYQTEQAVELVTKFQDILKSCRKQIDTIDKSVKNQFGYLIPNYDINSILESITNSSGDSLNNPDDTRPNKKRVKKSKTHRKRVASTTVTQTIGEEYSENQVTGVSVSSPTNASQATSSQWDDNVHSEVGGNEDKKSFKRKRDMVDFNPLGKKIILGSPEITQEDLEQIPDTWDAAVSEPVDTVSNVENGTLEENVLFMKELIKRQTALRKKKNIWCRPTRQTKRRWSKKSKNYVRKMSLQSSNSPQKRLGRPPKSEINTDEKTLLEQNSFEKLPKQLKQLRKPLRSSERKHPSSAAIAASYFPSAEELENINYCSLNYVIKPCFVAIHRLDPRVVQLLEKRVKEL